MVKLDTSILGINLQEKVKMEERNAGNTYAGKRRGTKL
jgi:hypothetical protein